MIKVKIVPIFDQSVPGIWDDFLRIRVAALRTNYNYEMGGNECIDAMNQYIGAWKKRCYNFAFGAYFGTEMVGFIHGDCIKNLATIRGLYVLPDFQSQKIGASLLRNAENASYFNARTVDLVSLGRALNFYTRNGYTPLKGGQNEFIKKMTGGGRCDTVPVFKANGQIWRACDEISHINNQVFDLSLVNTDHLPMFVYVDVNSDVKAFVIGGVDDSDKRYKIKQFNIAKHQPAELIRRRFERVFANLSDVYAFTHQTVR